MHTITLNIVKTLSLVLLTLLLNACGKSEQVAPLPPLTPITSADSCHVCGMTISGFAGPKGQAFVKHSDTALKFCSTADLFNWLLQPETAAILRGAFVHDMGTVAWDKPSDDHYINAKQAWYVIKHDQAGAMGPTLASFKDKLVAETYIHEHAGELKQYQQITLDLLSHLNTADTHHHL